MKNIKIKLLSLILVSILAVTSLTGCIVALEEGGASQEEPSPPVTENVNTQNNTVNNGWTVPETNSAVSILPTIADVVALVKPAVVSINTEVVTHIYNRQYTSEGAGSGWIIDPAGYIVTNNHVITDAQKITVILDDGRSFDAVVVGADSITDLAVVKIDAADLPVMEVGDSAQLRIGDWVVAIGNSLGQGVRATQGIVSRTGASLTDETGENLYNLIETDAAINPGNSGGPLVNMAGKVIGITNAKLASVEIESVGYAISTETAEPIIEQLINLGHAIHPWFGVSIYPYEINESIINQLSLQDGIGALLMEVASGSPAGKAGLQVYDVIISFNGRKVTNANDLIEGIRLSKVGQTVEIVYRRGVEEIITNATLTDRK